MHFHHDPDEWESVSAYRPCGHCKGDMSKCNGMCTGSVSYAFVRRSPEAIAEIKAKKQREHDKAVLQEAAEIIARRKAASP